MTDPLKPSVAKEPELSAEEAMKRDKEIAASWNSPPGDRFVDDGSGIRVVDRSEEEGEPFDFTDLGNDEEEAPEKPWTPAP